MGYVFRDILKIDSGLFVFLGADWLIVCYLDWKRTIPPRQFIRVTYDLAVAILERFLPS